MTVCIAARCGGADDPFIIGASDRMLTAGDVEFEPEQPFLKMGGVTSSIAVMVAGDSALQTELVQKVRAEVDRRIAAEPKTWLMVEDVARLYSHYYAEARLRRSEFRYLAPLGLDRNSFIARQQQMDPGLVQSVATELVNVEMPGVSTIFAGSDPSGLHIYVVREGEVSCEDGVAFAAIGIGAGHANSQFMLARHGWGKPFAATLLLTYSAKKRSEIAPGVGAGTDMFTVTARLGSLSDIGDHVMRELQTMYEKMVTDERKAFAKAQERADKYVKAIVAASTTQAQAAVPKDGGGSASADKKDISSGPQEVEPKA